METRLSMLVMQNLFGTSWFYLNMPFYLQMSKNITQQQDI